MRLYTDVHHVGIALILPFSSIMVKSPCSHVAVFAISAEGVACRSLPLWRFRAVSFVVLAQASDITFALSPCFLNTVINKPSPDVSPGIKR